MRIDFWIFGNGRGFGAPLLDTVFYWLVDRSNSRGRGRFYTWIGGFGAQLTSYEWRCPRPGVQRVLNGRKYQVFSAYRRWCKWDVSWAAEGVTTIEEIRVLRAELGG